MLSQLFSGFFFLFLRVSPSANFPTPLSRTEELEYFKKARSGDEKARSILIERNLRLVAHIAKKYSFSGYKAIDSYNPESSARFATYAVKCLQNEILMYFRSQKKHLSETSINEVLDTDKDGNPLTYMDILSTEDDIAEKIDVKIKVEKLMKYINTCLDSREKQIIFMRYALGFNKSMTQREIAHKLGISRSYVSRIENTAIEKLRSCF